MSGVHYVCDPEGYLEPKIGNEGAAALPATTIINAFKKVVENFPDRPALCLKRPGVIPAEWQTWSWREYYSDCRAFAKTLITLEVNVFKIVNILGFNSPEWLIANCGSILAGAIAAGIYATNTPEACHYITDHSKAEVVVLEGNKQLVKYTSSTYTFSKLKAIVVWGEPIDPAIASKCLAPVHSWEDFLKMGSGVSDDALDARGAKLKPGNCATLIYTSGTTGPPKAVMLSHDNITWTVYGMCNNGYVDLNHTDRIISFLPLSHIAAQLIDIYVPMTVGGASYFAQPDALKGSLVTSIKDIKPTVFFGVPRVWEKIQEKMVQVGRANSGLKQAIATWAKSIGTEKNRRAQYGNEGGVPWGYACANKIVFMTIKKTLGFDQCKAFFTAAAPIALDTLQYFASLDIPVYEVFGQSECSGPQTVSSHNNWKMGTCGRPFRGTQSMIAEGTGELCYRGRHIMMGYMYMPKETAETIDSEGYLHSGDVAEFDKDDSEYCPPPSGFMKITGRIKDLIITAGGENVPPILIENEMKAAMVAISNCLVVGDKRKYLSMLITLKTEVDLATATPTNVLAADALFIGKQIGSNATTVEEVMKDPLWTKYFNEGMKKANAKTTSNAQIVQKWRLLKTDFSESAGDLTPTMKLKRNVVLKKYAKEVDAIYAEKEQDSNRI